MTSKVTTHNAADSEAAELASQIQRACVVFRNTGDVNRVDLAGFRLNRTQYNTWEVETRSDETADRELVDELDPGEFRSAQVLLQYVHGYQRTTDSEDARQRPEPWRHGVI